MPHAKLAEDAKAFFALCSLLCLVHTYFFLYHVATNQKGNRLSGKSTIMEAPQNSKYSLTEDGILKKLLLVAVPIMGTNFMQMAYILTDMFWLGKVGSGAVAAVGSAGMYFWLSVGFFLIGRSGAEIGVSQSLGKGDKKSAISCSQNAFFIGLVIGLLYAMAMVFLNRQLIGFFNFRETDVANEAAGYLFISGFIMPFVFLKMVAIGTFNASGNSRTPFYLNSLGIVLNIILDPVFILILGMGVKGAAIATVIAEATSCGGIFIAFFASKYRPFEHFSVRFRPEPEKIKQILKWSVPIGLENILFCFLAMITTRIETSFGADAIAVSKIGSQVESLSWLIGGGFGTALITFVGQNYGAGKWERIHRGTKIAALVMAVWGTTITLAFITLGGAIFSLFLPAPNLITLGKQYLFILAFAQLSMNLEIVAASAFKGTGRTIPPSIASITSNILRPPLALLLSRTGLGLHGIWIAVTITSVFRGLWICLWYLYAGKKRVYTKPSA